uniref:Putative ixodes 10 kDa peptide protein n=1 Tax=Ixodes ricinus TaxID=34613 RepID=A0A0K8R5W9_IXORI
MLFALFAVVLVLPAFEGEGSLSAVDPCNLALMHGGSLYCQLSGYDKSDGVDFSTCMLRCDGTNVTLPVKACPNGSLDLQKSGLGVC